MYILLLLFYVSVQQKAPTESPELLDFMKVFIGDREHNRLDFDHQDASKLTFYHNFVPGDQYHKGNHNYH